MLKRFKRSSIKPQRLVALSLLSLLASVLAGCMHRGPMGTESLAELKNIRASGGKDEAVTMMRNQAIQDTAMSVGAQSGLAWRAEQVNEILQAKSKYLDQVFNFGGLMLGSHVLPPVLVTSNKSLKLDSADTIRLSDQTYKILNQAKFVTTPPTWRDYLWMS
jgi:defect in organelle trafficking protein DotC